MIVKEEANQSLRTNKKRRWDKKHKEVEVMHVGEHTLGVVSFSTTDGEGVEMPHDNALVIEAIIHNFSVRNIFLDDGSKVNLLSY